LKKIIIPAAVIAAGIAGLLLVSPSAIAQISNSTGTNGNAATPNGTTPNGTIHITGTISLSKLITDQIKVSFSDAAKTAQDQISGGVVVGGNLGPMQGYLVYIFKVVNPSTNTVYMVVVDPGNGSVLYTSQGHPIGNFMGHGFGGAEHGWGMKMHKYSGQAWSGQQQQQQPSTTPQSQTMSIPPAILSNS
jgi:hypothetical protein